MIAADLDLQCFQKKDNSGFSSTRVNVNRQNVIQVGLVLQLQFLLTCQLLMLHLIV